MVVPPGQKRIELPKGPANRRETLGSQNTILHDRCKRFAFRDADWFCR